MPEENKKNTAENKTVETMQEKLQRTLKTVAVNGEKFYVAEGDLLIEENKLAEYAKEREDKIKNTDVLTQIEDNGRTSLLGISDNGKTVRWKPGTVLTYCVLKNTFGDTNKYDLVRNNMKGATWDWQSVCGVQFEHKPEFDDMLPAGNANNVLFTVQEIDTGGQFIAASFFPNDPPNRRTLIIDPSYFTTGFDKVGVLRHELGHVIGFRHEHIRSAAPPACQGEDVGEVIELTKYDPKSVMHYFCGGVGSRELKITDSDIAGAIQLYGPSLDGMSLFT